MTKAIKIANTPPSVADGASAIAALPVLLGGALVVDGELPDVPVDPADPDEPEVEEVSLVGALPTAPPSMAAPGRLVVALAASAV